MRAPTAVTTAAIAFLALACGGESHPSSRASSNPQAVDRLNKLIRGEVSAVETYRQAIAKEGSPSEALSSIQADHADAADRLRERVRALGGTPSTDSGPWGDLAKALEGTAKVFGNDAAIAALKSGEKHGVSEYEEALADSALDTASKDLIRNTLLPRQGEHERRLESAKTQ